MSSIPPTDPTTPPPPPASQQMIPPSPSGDLIYPSIPPKDPAIALIINIFLPGIGQIYIGQVAKGLTIFFGSMILWALILTLSAVCIGVFMIPIGLAVYVGALIDAFQQAKILQGGRPIGQWTLFSAGR